MSLRRLLFAAVMFALPIGVGAADPIDDPAPPAAAGDAAAVEATSTDANDEPAGLGLDGVQPQPEAVRAANPNSNSVGALPFPQPAPGSGSDVPNSWLFYLLPLIGLWLILRRRTRGTRHH